MGILNLNNASFSIMALIFFMSSQVNGLMPYTRSSVWDMMMPEDPFRILEHSPFTISKGPEPMALARADWKETPQFHIIALDIPGMKKDDVKIEVDENRVLRIIGERRAEQEIEGVKWHRAERSNGQFWRQFRLPGNAYLDHVKAHLEDGVLTISIFKIHDADNLDKRHVIDICYPGEDNEGTCKADEH